MKSFKHFALLSLSLLLISALALSGCGSEAPKSEEPEESAAPAPEAMPDSVLFYGELTEIITDDDGSIKQLLMNSQRDGELVLNVGPQTFWVDWESLSEDDISELSVGESFYVFHAPVATMSLPPQSPALAVVRNLPMDARCAMYHEVEALETEGEGLIITTDNGSKKLSADADTAYNFYDGSEASADALKEGGFIMVIYDENPSIPYESPRAFRILILPQGE